MTGGQAARASTDALLARAAPTAHMATGACSLARISGSAGASRARVPTTSTVSRLACCVVTRTVTARGSARLH